MNLLKVIIADDEISVCKLILNLIDWPSFDMEIVSVVHNSIDAISSIKAYDPDLIITDIRMPGCDGLELIAKAKEMSSHLDFIIISGYQHFEYAKCAVKYQVQDYILKPVKKEELSSALRKIQSSRNAKSIKAALEEELELRRKSDADMLRSRAFNEFLALKLLPDDTSLEQLNKVYHFNFKPGAFQIFIAKIDCQPMEQCNAASGVFMDKLIPCLRREIEGACFDLQLSVDGNRIYGLLNLDLSLHPQIRRHFKAALDDLLLQSNVFGELSLSIGLGKPVPQFSQLSASLNSAEMAVAQRLVKGAGVLSEEFSTDLSVESHKAIIRMMTSLRKNMFAAIEKHDQAMLAACLENFRQRLFEIEDMTGYFLFSIVCNIHSTFLMLLNERFTQLDYLKNQQNVFSQKADLCGSDKSLCDFLIYEISKTFSDAMHELKQAETKPMRLAKEYIQKHYASPLTLKTMAEVIGFNHTYFSTLFKKESGISFLEYLSEVRVLKACDLLKETNKTIASICEEVGYSDLKHFTKVFKKHTELNPNEYRRLFS
jgi:two-component system response regulator YesN